MGEFLKFFGDQNQGRVSRLGVFERDAATDKWIESGLPLLGIDEDTHDNNAAEVKIMLGDAKQKDARTLYAQYPKRSAR